MFLNDRGLEWTLQATEADHQLNDKIYSFEEYFDDMLFRPESKTGKLIACQSKPANSDEWIDDEVPLPDELEYFSYSCCWIKVGTLERGIGCFNEEDFSLTVAPEYADNDAVILHEMIHLHETVVNKLPMFYHDAIYWCLYRELKDKVPDLDDRIEAHGHMLNEQSLYSYGGLHDILFLLKSFEIDILRGYKLGTVFGYGMAEE